DRVGAGGDGEGAVTKTWRSTWPALSGAVCSVVIVTIDHFRNFAGGRSGWRQQPPSSTLTSMPFMHRSSNCSTRPYAANPSPLAAGWCSLPRTKPSHLESVAVCQGGGLVSCVRN